MANPQVMQQIHTVNYVVPTPQPEKIQQVDTSKNVVPTTQPERCNNLTLWKQTLLQMISQVLEDSKFFPFFISYYLNITYYYFFIKPLHYYRLLLLLQISKNYLV